MALKDGRSQDKGILAHKFNRTHKLKEVGFETGMVGVYSLE